MSSPETFADLRADASAALDSLPRVALADVTADTANARSGWTLWRCGRMSVHLPTMRADAPPEAVARYWLRIRAGLTGECEACGQVAGITGPDDPTRAAWWLLPVTIRLDHLPECPALFRDDEAHLFDAEAWT